MKKNVQPVLEQFRLEFQRTRSASDGQSMPAGHTSCLPGSIAAEPHQSGLKQCLTDHDVLFPIARECTLMAECDRRAGMRDRLDRAARDRIWSV